MDSILKVLANEVQIGALIAMGVMYAIRVFWLLSLPKAGELARPKNSPVGGIVLSFSSVLTPWFAIGTRKQLVIYTEFVLFHIAVALAIAFSFIHTYAPQLLTSPVSYTFAAFLGFGLLSGIIRLIRRVIKPEVRSISTPDDYFSISLLNIYLMLTLLALFINNLLLLVIFFIVTAFFLLYIPWSKISHYLYILFSRFYFGFYFGRRGVIARKKTLEV